MIEFQIQAHIWWLRLFLRFWKQFQQSWFFRSMEPTTITLSHTSFWLVACVESCILKYVATIWNHQKRPFLLYRKFWTRKLEIRSSTGKMLLFGLWLHLPFSVLDLYLMSCKIHRMFLEVFKRILLWDKLRVFWFW